MASRTVSTGWPAAITQRVLSDPWPLQSSAEGYFKSPQTPQPFHGYFFRILTKQGNEAPGGAEEYVVNGNMTGGFAILAYPAEYRNSGVMSFLISRDGVVF